MGAKHSRSANITFDKTASSAPEIRYLENDPELPNQKYALVSFIHNPDGDLRGFKIRGVYKDHSRAVNARETRTRENPIIPADLVPVGQWVTYNCSLVEAHHLAKDMGCLMVTDPVFVVCSYTVNSGQETVVNQHSVHANHDSAYAYARTHQPMISRKVYIMKMSSDEYYEMFPLTGRSTCVRQHDDSDSDSHATITMINQEH